MFAFAQILAALSFFILFTECRILKARATTPDNADLTLELYNATILANDTTIVPDPSSPEAYWPVNLASPGIPLSSLPANNATTVAALSPGPPQYNCNGKHYGRNLNVQSCTAALNSITDLDIPRTFGQRDQGKWDVPLPFRILSHDGLCAIDVSLKAGAVFDTVVPTVMKQNVAAILTICVKGSPNLGGVATNIGENGALIIRMVPYRPNVHCEGPNTAPPPKTCRRILDVLPTDGTQKKFGRKDDEEAQVWVPKKWQSSDRRCLIVVDTVFSTDVSDWYKLWAAAIAVETMCVEARGEGGIAPALGQMGNLFVAIMDMKLHPLDPPLLASASTTNTTALDIFSV